MNKHVPSDQRPNAAAAEQFLTELRAFDGFGRKTVTETVADIPYLINEFWTAAQRKAHSIHEVSYRACFKAQLPAFFISRLTGPGDVILDPFMGRGTTPVQAALMGRQAIGNDINPLSVLLTRPRLRPISMDAVAAALASVDWSSGTVQRKDLLTFYHPETLRKLEALRLWLAEHAPLGSAQVDPVADWIRMVAINRLSGHSPGFFSGRSMPPNQAVSIKAQLRINEKLGLAPPERDVAALILRKTKSLLKDGCAPGRVRSDLHAGPAWSLPNLPDGSVDLTVTSPPFMDIVHYTADNWLRCWFAGIDTNTVDIDMHRGQVAWSAMVRKVLVEQARVLRPGGYVAFEVGEVRGGKLLLDQLVWQTAHGLPFHRLGVMVNAQSFTKTANLWGIDNGTKGTNTNRIVLLQRH